MIRHYPDEASWKRARRFIVTASDLPCLLKMVEPNSPWFLTPDELLRSKLTGEEPPRLVTRDMIQYRNWGKIQERNLRHEYARITGYPCERMDGTDLDSREPDYTMVVSDTHPFFGATPDMKANHPDDGWGPVELKNVGHSLRGEWLTPTNVSPRWTHSVAAGAKPGTFAAFIEDHEADTRKGCGHSHKTKEAAEECGRAEESRLDVTRGNPQDDGRKVPSEKMAQVQGEIFAFGADWGGLIACLGGNTTLEPRYIIPDKDWVDFVMLPAVESFYHRIISEGSF